MRNSKVLERLEFLKVLKDCKRKKCALFVVDIDDFKLVNFSYGYSMGDRVIAAVEKKLVDVVEKYFSECVFGRVGSNSFAVLMKVVDKELSYRRIEEIYTKYLERLNFKIGSDFFSLTTSAGVAFSLGVDDVGNLFKKAEEALYNAKKRGKNCIVFSTNSSSTRFEEIQEIRKRLVEAIEKRSVEPYFQPILSLRTGKIYGYEVLARIFSEGKVLRGDYVIDIANTFNLIPEIDRIVFEKASKYLDKGYKLFFNLSMKYFFKELNNIWRMVKDRGLNSSNIVIEITESQKVMEMNVAKSIFQIFRDMDAKIAIDDFGSGYSSFSYLKRFPADILKIDGEFVKGAKRDKRDLTIMKSIVEVARPFRLRVLAEFIEDEEDYRLMKEIGVSLGQGWFIGKPKPEPYDVRIDI
ncbi:bifunctional diguanylate cyclase/phosphodiesterase [Desulfurobacterium atlanticum]|uniref:Diguanylate cyclase (GGDEF) domain-containing protein n=1 Tax=Desulfurobacterium atlanticum TaxID=240169 RepID=A0A239A9E7_9BACT|nr:bifunctional diguanylate cyclase/phosphodiesterase [Desulfurobacterium atlanticum]SNR92190.1 diguanylate cyclase (GGDEF) domain-containing protein [Desulfurobacterium atlanticum]